MLPIPRTVLASCASAVIDIPPQRALCGPYRIRFPKDLHGLLAIEDIQFGQQSLFGCSGAVPIEILESMPDLDGYELQLGNILRLRVLSRAPHSIEVVGSVLCHNAVVERLKVRPLLRVAGASKLFDAIDLCDATNADDFAEPSSPQELYRPERCPVPFEPPAPVEMISPRRPCGSRRPDSHEPCVLRRGHLEQHFDGLGQSWPEQATPSRRELERREYERTNYLEEPDAWNAWESATDES